MHDKGTVSGADLRKGIYRLNEKVVISVGNAVDYVLTAKTETPQEESATPEEFGTIPDATNPWTLTRTERDYRCSNGVIASTNDTIQIICRYDSECTLPSTNDTPATAPETQAKNDTSWSTDAREGEFSSIVEIDGDSFVIHSRLAGCEKKNHKSDGVERGGSQQGGYRDLAALDETRCAGIVRGPSIAEQCRRFYEARLLSRWCEMRDAADQDHRVTSPTANSLASEHDEAVDCRPTSVDSGRDSATDSLGSLCSSARAEGSVVRSGSQRSAVSGTTEDESDSDSSHGLAAPTVPERMMTLSTCKVTPRTAMVMKLKVLHREMVSTVCPSTRVHLGGTKEASPFEHWRTAHCGLEQD